MRKNPLCGGALLFLDQEKCFDRVEHGFIFRVMAKMGYGKILSNGLESFIMGFTVGF